MSTNTVSNYYLPHHNASPPWQVRITSIGDPDGCRWHAGWSRGPAKPAIQPVMCSGSAPSDRRQGTLGFCPSLVTTTMHCDGQVFASRDLTNNGGIPFGGLVSLVPTTTTPIPAITRPPTRCLKCAAYLHRHCLFAPPVWHCPMCLHANPLDAAMQPDTMPECLADAFDYLAQDASAPPPPLLLLLLDATLPPTALQQACSALQHVMQHAMHNQPVCLLVCSSTVRALRCGAAKAVHWDVLGSDTPHALPRVDLALHVGQLPRDADTFLQALANIRCAATMHASAYECINLQWRVWHASCPGRRPGGGGVPGKSSHARRGACRWPGHAHAVSNVLRGRGATDRGPRLPQR